MKKNDSTPIRRLRIKRCLSLRAFGDIIGIDAANLSRIERGKKKVTPEVAARIASKIDGITEMEILYPERFND